MPSSHLILCRPLLLLLPIPSSIRVFSNESTLHMSWSKYWSFSFSISPSNEHPGLISFRMDWLDLLAVQETLKSLLQHHSSKASVLWRSAFFTAQLSHPYMTTGKTIALIRWTFVGKVMSLLFNMLSRLVITFLPRSKRLLISWLQSPSAVILESILPVEPLECGSSLFQLCVQWCQFGALKLVWKEYLHLGNQQVLQNSFSPSKELISKSLDIIQITVYYHKLGMILLVPGALYISGTCLTIICP